MKKSVVLFVLITAVTSAYSMNNEKSTKVPIKERIVKIISQAFMPTKEDQKWWLILLELGTHGLVK